MESGAHSAPQQQPSYARPKVIAAGSFTIAYTDEGAGSATAVTVPGLPGSNRDFRWLAPLLSPHMRVIRMDPPGYGRSPRPNDSGMSVAERAAATEDLLDALDLGPVMLISHSAGGVVAARLARMHPQRITSLAMLAPPGPEPHFDQRPLRRMAPVLATAPGAWVMKNRIRSQYREMGFPRYLRDDEMRFALLDAAKMDFADYAEDAAGLSQRTLVSWAGDDHVISDTLTADLVDLVPRSQALRFDDGGHSIPKTRAKELAPAILALAGTSG